MEALSPFDAFVVYVLAFSGLISFLVFIHEWAHYATARALGIRASVFSVGMGPAILSRKDRNGCTWQLAAFPIGGYVKFLGDRDGSSVTPVSAADAALPPSEARAMLHMRKPWERALVVAAGPAINILFGLAVITTVFLVNGKPFTEPTVGDVVAGQPADLAGFRPGDRILSISGQPVDSFEKVVEIVGMRPNTPFQFEVRRGEETLTLSAVSSSQVITVMGVEQTVGRIGVGSAGDRGAVDVGPGEAVVLGIENIWSMTKTMFLAISQIATGDRPLSDVGGPVRIAELSGNAATLGVLPFALLMAMISVNLGVVNLLPIPVLDGGHLVVCAWEAVTRRKANERVLLNLSRVGGLFLVVVFVGLTISDLTGIGQRFFN